MTFLLGWTKKESMSHGLGQIVFLTFFLYEIVIGYLICLLKCGIR